MSGVVDRLCASVRKSEPMDASDLATFIGQVAARTLPVESITLWLKAVHKHGISVEDTVTLTEGMMNSGAVLKWDSKRPIADKHSTGGVGDKMSLMLAPALAACGVEVPMLAGRGLGHTGGTIDKLESIPGFNCALDPDQMEALVNQIGCCIAAQNDSIAPADGLLYAIRDVTHTVDSIPLITASIVSKKAAEGLKALVLDVKCGHAAFMKTEEQATLLATSMVETAKGLGIETVAQITEMNEPIGTHIGNALEVIESIEVLNGKGPSDTVNLVALQGGALLNLLNLASSPQAGEQKILEALNNGEAAKKFEAMCVGQGVDAQTAKRLLAEPTAILAQPSLKTKFRAHETGWVGSIRSMALAEIARAHGAGRFHIEDTIDEAVGFIVHTAKGARIEEGDVWMEFHHNQPVTASQKDALSSALHITSHSIKPVERLIKVVE